MDRAQGCSSSKYEELLSLCVCVFYSTRTLRSNQNKEYISKVRRCGTQCVIMGFVVVVWCVVWCPAQIKRHSLSFALLPLCLRSPFCYPKPASDPPSYSKPVGSGEEGGTNRGPKSSRVAPGCGERALTKPKRLKRARSHSNPS